jgi:hypothetical protein
MSLMKRITQRIKEIIFWRKYWKEEEIVATTKGKAKKTIKRMSGEDKEYIKDVSNLISDMLWPDYAWNDRELFLARRRNVRGKHGLPHQKTIKRIDDE